MACFVLVYSRAVEMGNDKEILFLLLLSFPVHFACWMVMMCAACKLILFSFIEPENIVCLYMVGCLFEGKKRYMVLSYHWIYLEIVQTTSQCA